MFKGKMTLNCTDVLPMFTNDEVILLNNAKLLPLRSQLKSPFIEMCFDKCAGLTRIAFRYGKRWCWFQCCYFRLSW